MSPSAKVILENSLKEFRKANSYKKDEMLSLVKRRIKQHENGLKTIGTGYADYFVEAGKEFIKRVS